jgi:hypothetical protein
VAEFVEAARLADLPPGRGTVVTIADKDVALFNVEGNVYAMGRRPDERKARMTAQEFFARVWEMLIGRLLVQPTVAAIFAVRAGWRDARAHRPRYLWSVVTNPATRRDLLRQELADVGKVFVVSAISRRDLRSHRVSLGVSGAGADRRRRPGIHSIYAHPRPSHSDCASLRPSMMEGSAHEHSGTYQA